MPDTQPEAEPGTLDRFIAESPDPVAVLDEGGFVVVANDGWRQLGGPTPGAHLDAWPPMAGAWEAVRRDGWARVCGSASPDARAVRAFIARIDIVERGRFVVRAHPDVASEPAPRDRFFALIDNFPFAIGVHRNSRFVYVNRAAVNYLGYGDSCELVGEPVTVIVTPDEIPLVRERIAHMVRTGEPLPERETRLIRKDGVVVVAELAAFQIRDADGLPTYVVVARDVTERRTIEQRLRQGQRLEAIGRLVGGIAHDFNNILAVILSQAEWLDSDAGRADPEAATRAIIEASRRATTLTQQLVTFTHGRPSAHGAPAGTSGPTNADGVLHEVAAFLARGLGDAITLVVDVPPPTAAAPGPNASHQAPYAVCVGASELEQIVTNLVLNARDALPSGGTIAVRLAGPTMAPQGAGPGLKPGAHIVLEVSDDGVGMPDDVKARAFEPFFTTKPAGKGTGLGLSSVYGIVRQAGGTVEIESRPSAGTTVRAYLPAYAPPGPQAASQTGPRSRPGPRPAPHTQVLLVEDDEAVRVVLARLLRQHGYEVLEAVDAEQAIALVQGGLAPALLVTDVIMPEVSGPQLAERIRGLRPGLPVLFVSGYSDDVLSPNHLDAVGVGFLAKPFTAAELFKAVAALIA